MHEELRKAVCDANIELQRRNLVIYSWGNVSGIDRSTGIVAIKPSGVSYNDLTPDKIVLLDLNGKIVEGQGEALRLNKPASGGLNPSSDTPTHLELYRHFEAVGGICHSHSPSATMWAQACREIPCFGTTHADYFYGSIPVTEIMTKNQIQSDYELNTGKVIVRRFADVDPMKMPGVLVANHGPFSWGRTPAVAVESMVVLEQIATMALGTIMINPSQGPIGKVLLDKHYLRKHGKNAYYGQNAQKKEKTK
jgi:L-ribulose-5-phosphate 4-epimerase